MRNAPRDDAPVLVRSIDAGTDTAPIVETHAGWHRIEHRQRTGRLRTRDAREDGRLAAARERRYDRMDPACGREPGHPQAEALDCP